MRGNNESQSIIFISSHYLSIESMIWFIKAPFTIELKYFGQETIGQLHRKACEIFDLQSDQVKSFHNSIWTSILYERFFKFHCVVIIRFPPFRYVFGTTMAVESMP